MLLNQSFESMLLKQSFELIYLINALIKYKLKDF